MDKRYQVFVSSTYEDLQEERKEVMQALLELDCIPAGMELFPASNEDQWSLIKRVIDDSDYYIVIIGGRYGSTNDEGISYTEMEYRYALETQKPIIAFLHKNPEEIKSRFTEKTQEGRERLNLFRDLAKTKLVRHWTNSSELGSVVSRSLVNLIKQFPSVGWVRADAAAAGNEDTIRELLSLKKENEELKKQLQHNKVTAPAGSERLAQGDDPISITFRYRAETIRDETEYLSDSITTTWNNLFAIIAPHMSIECSELAMKWAISSYGHELLHDIMQKKLTRYGYREFSFFNMDDREFQNIKIQFKALGLITKSIKNRSVKDRETYWTLTDYGDFIMTQLVAIKKDT